MSLGPDGATLQILLPAAPQPATPTGLPWWAPAAAIGTLAALVLVGVIGAVLAVTEVLA
ncbi:hypothetical protein AB1484_29355 [Parafrankia sp. FMc6]|uniref:hypothetical protein n=1 Tax=Parafrankia soli TaxID=2599596 RepID=UPI0034D68060